MGRSLGWYPINPGLVLQHVCPGKESHETSVDAEGCLDSAAIRVKHSRPWYKTIFNLLKRMKKETSGHEKLYPSTVILIYISFFYILISFCDFCFYLTWADISSVIFFWLSDVGLSVYKLFSYLSSSPETSHWASFNQTWHKAFLDDVVLLMGTVSHVSKMARGPQFFFILTNVVWILCRKMVEYCASFQRMTRVAL